MTQGAHLPLFFNPGEVSVFVRGPLGLGVSIVVAGLLGCESKHKP